MEKPDRSDYRRVREGFTDLLKQMIADATEARRILADAMSGSEVYSAQQIATARKIVDQAFTAADRIFIYDLMDDVEEMLNAD